MLQLRWLIDVCWDSLQMCTPWLMTMMATCCRICTAKRRWFKQRLCLHIAHKFQHSTRRTLNGRTFRRKICWVYQRMSVTSIRATLTGTCHTRPMGHPHRKSTPRLKVHIGLMKWNLICDTLSLSVSISRGTKTPAPWNQSPSILSLGPQPTQTPSWQIRRSSIPKQLPCPQYLPH